MTLKLFAMVAAFTATVSTFAFAETITFSSSTSVAYAPFVASTEGGFKVTSYQGDFMVGQQFGDPAPDLFNYDESSTIEITQSAGAQFVFDSVDSATFGGGVFIVTGLLDRSVVYTSTQEIDDIGNFETYELSSSSVPVNALRITLSGPLENDLDNITVHPAAITVHPAASTPEPASLVLLATGLLGMGTFRKVSKPV